MALTILEKMSPMAGPSRARITITTMATKTRINAYSTKPWPFSFGANNIGYFLLSLIFLSFENLTKIITFLFSKAIEFNYKYLTAFLEFATTF